MRRAIYLGGVGLACAVALAGCNRSSAVPPVATVAETANSMTNAFLKAPPDAQMQAGMALAAAQKGDLVSSYAQLQELARRPDLTAEQRRAAFDAERAALSGLKEAATNGNVAAEAAIRHFRLSK